MKNKFKDNLTATIILDKDMKGGDAFQKGALKGVLISDGLANDAGEIALIGQFTLPVKAGETLACGDKLYLDASGSMSKTGSGDHFGVSVEDTPAGAAHAVVLI